LKTVSHNRIHGPDVHRLSTNQERIFREREREAIRAANIIFRSVPNKEEDGEKEGKKEKEKTYRENK